MKRTQMEIVFGCLVEDARKAKGMTRAEMAKELDITQAYYSQLANARRSIDLEMALRVCKVLGIDWNEVAVLCE